MARLLLLVAGLLLVVTACGAPAVRPSEPPRVSAPTTVLADGTVPWVDEPAGKDEFSLPPRVRRVDPAAAPCVAAELRGELSSWPAAGDSGEPEAAKDLPTMLIGFARVTNIGERTCRLRGEVDTRLRGRDGSLNIGYSHDVNEEGARRVTIVPPGESADLRLAWTAPFCVPAGGLDVVIALPEDGGTLRAPMTDPTVPPCGATDGFRPGTTSFLSASAFDEVAEPTVMDSPLAKLTATIEPVATAGPDELVTFHVMLTNPTAAVVPLDPCPGYYQERFSQGSAEVPAINDGGPYRLNCRAVKSVPANGSVRFAMGVRVPSELTGGRQLTVTWWLIAPTLAGEPHLRGSFTLTTTER